MKEDNKLQIDSVYQELCQRDPEWRQPKMQKQFKTLFLGWRQAELRAKRHTGYFYSISWRRGWLPQGDFARFREYTMQ